MSEGIRQRSRESHLDACVAQGGAYKFLIQKSNQRIKGIVHNFFLYRSNLIFWIVMGCGIADFGRRGL